MPLETLDQRQNALAVLLEKIGTRYLWARTYQRQSLEKSSFVMPGILYCISQFPDGEEMQAGAPLSAYREFFTGGSNDVGISFRNTAFIPVSYDFEVRLKDFEDWANQEFEKLFLSVSAHADALVPTEVEIERERSLYQRFLPERGQSALPFRYSMALMNAKSYSTHLLFADKILSALATHSAAQQL